MKPNRSLVNSCNPMGLWTSNLSTCFGRMKLNKAFLKAVYDVMLLILMSSLFHSVMTFGKKEFLKYSVVLYSWCYILCVIMTQRIRKSIFDLPLSQDELEFSKLGKKHSIEPIRINKTDVLTLSWRTSLSYRNQSINLLCKSMDWFLYGRDLRHEQVNYIWFHLSGNEQRVKERERFRRIENKDVVFYEHLHQ